MFVVITLSMPDVCYHKVVIARCLLS